MALPNLNALQYSPYPASISRYAPRPISGGTPVRTPPVPQSQIVGYSVPEAMQSFAVPVSALPSTTQALAGVPATFSIAGMGMMPLLILALVLYFIFKG